jgi:hypothetical protein
MPYSIGAYHNTPAGQFLNTIWLAFTLLRYEVGCLESNREISSLGLAFTHTTKAVIHPTGAFILIAS